MVELKEVESSALSAIGYDPTSKVLAVRFKAGGVHHFRDVPAEVASGLQRAESVGKYYSTHIRGKFDSVPVVEAED
jgi:hypothetical protein